MDFEQDLQDSLNKVISTATELLQFLKCQPSSDTRSGPSSFSSDPLDCAPPAIRQSRKSLAEAATRLVLLGTRPDEYLEHLTNSYQNLTCTRWLVDLDVLNHIPQHEAIDYDDLAGRSGVPAKQLKGVARMAIVNGFLREPETNHVAHSRLSALLVSDGSFMNWARWLLNYSVPVAYKFADATRRWGETTAKNETAFNLSLDTNNSFFDYIRKTTELTSLFSGYMKNVNSSRTWSIEHAVAGFDWASLPPGATVVDVGGSHGAASVAVARKFPDLSFIVQDLPETVATAKKAFDADTSIDAAVKSRIQFMEHDFFKPQTVKDAHVYFLRMIIHDWPDKEAHTILEQIQKVVHNNPNARIVVMDTVLPPPGSTSILRERQLRTRDLIMMQVFNSRERELEDWENLASGSGWEITDVVQPSESVMALLTLRPAHHKPTLTSSQTNGHVKKPDSILANGFKHDQPVNGVNKEKGINGSHNGETFNDVEPNKIVNGDLGRSTLPINGTPHPTSKPVLIMGAGISGLCFAQSLRRAGIDFHIFERDPAVDSRPQGYRLKLEAGGAQALRDSLPDDMYHTFESSCAITTIGETDLSPFTGLVTRSRAGGGLSGTKGLHPNFTVDRRAFRQALMTGIEDRISFGKELVSYDIDTDTNTVVARFKSGAPVEGGFLVGADGLHSVVRKKHVPQHILVDTGATCVYGKTTINHEVLARFPEKGLRWMTVISDSAPMLQSCLIGESPVTMLLEPIRFSASSRSAHDLPADYLYWALIGPTARFSDPTQQPPTESSKPNVPSSHASSQSASLANAVTQEWHPSIRSVIDQQDTSQTTTLRVASTVADIPDWTPSALVTVLGDAIHPMSPCGGVGANTALADAAALGAVFAAAKAKGGAVSAEMVGEFEAAMRTRARASIVRSEVGSRMMFGQKRLVDCEVLSV